MSEKTYVMFTRHKNAADIDRVDITIGGRPVAARSGDTVAAALLLADVTPYRLIALDRKPRAPCYLMSACFDCLVTIDGPVNRRACLIEVRGGDPSPPEGRSIRPRNILTQQSRTS